MEDNFSSTLLDLQSHYLLTHVGNQTIAFPSQWVAEIVLAERSRILALPFYSPLLLGVFHHQGLILPIITGRILLPEERNQDISLAMPKETLSVIRLGQSAEHLAGIGIVVDRVIDRVVDRDRGVDSTQPKELQQTIHFQLADIPNPIWQPL
ncbi:MAG: chemotaxis protein CheW [Oscillatoriophycideae cyanobacterium NC_groundwater_1537_Pr4_S-0.65um_50_18]|nr:chemotaxis protein CheW [Oscillatoriophycideae cyanobacterium NC_groundwater_1537_Pr4_S-0.65um_50_18]